MNKERPVTTARCDQCRYCVTCYGLKDDVRANCADYHKKDSRRTTGEAEPWDEMSYFRYGNRILTPAERTYQDAVTGWKEVRKDER